MHSQPILLSRARALCRHTTCPFGRGLLSLPTPSPPTICKYKAAAGLPRRCARSLDGPSTTTPSPRWRHVVHGPQNAKGGGGHRHKWPLDVRDAHGATGVAAAVTPATGRAAEPDHGCDSWRAANFVRLATGPPPHQRVPNACTRAHTHVRTVQHSTVRCSTAQYGLACRVQDVIEGGRPPAGLASAPLSPIISQQAPRTRRTPRTSSAGW